MDIRDLDPVTDLDAVYRFYQDAPDYRLLAEGIAPDLAKARAFFTDAPPQSDPARSHRMGLFIDGRLSGLAELSFDWPAKGDPFLGLMILGPWAQGQGAGQVFLAEVITRAKSTGAKALYLAVLDQNPRGRVFWERQGFTGTGVRATWETVAGPRSAERMVRPLD